MRAQSELCRRCCRRISTRNANNTHEYTNNMTTTTTTATTPTAHRTSQRSIFFTAFNMAQVNGCVCVFVVPSDRARRPRRRQRRRKRRRWSPKKFTHILTWSRSNVCASFACFANTHVPPYITIFTGIVVELLYFHFSSVRTSSSLVWCHQHQ